jgi:hypothetical protein
MVCGRTGRPIGRASVQKQPTTRPRLAAGAKVNSEFRIMDVFYKIRVTKSTKIRTPRLVRRRSSTEAQSETAVRVV